MSMIQKANQLLTQIGDTLVPMIGYCQPQVLAVEPDALSIGIPLTERTSNHLNSMYFGALAVGADLAGGLLAVMLAEAKGVKLSLAFKSVEGEFFKRPEADVCFRCEDGAAIATQLEEAIQGQCRINMPVQIVATCPALHGDEAVARFTLTLSFKVLASADSPL